MPANAGQKCGAQQRLSIYNVVASNIPASETEIDGYKGCFQIATFNNNRGYTFYGNTMTYDYCSRTCKNRGFAWAGVYAGNTCSCSNKQDWGGELPLIMCSTPCAGDSKKVCGAPGYISLFDTSASTASAPEGFPANYVGCYQDTVNPRSLGMASTTSGTSMSSSFCRSFCAGKGYSIYGTEQTTCYCGSSLPTSKQNLDSSCNYPCAGNQTEMCGASNQLSVYNAALSIVSTTSYNTIVSVHHFVKQRNLY